MPKTMMKTQSKMQSVTLEIASINELMVNNQKTIIAVVPTSSFLNTEIPNNANSREYTGNKNRAVGEMIKTLKSEPENFRFKNLGIRIVANDYVRNENSITLYFDEDEGIFNGGHTYNVLKKYGRDTAFILVTVDLSIPKEHLVDVSLALNMTKKLEVTSQGEKIGAFNWIKEVLPSEPIVFKEGGTGTVPVEDIIKVANIFRIGKGKQYAETALTKSLKGKASLVKENNNKQTLRYTGYILPDMWELYNKIRTDEDIRKNLPLNFSRKNELLQGPSLVFLSGARYMTEINKNMIPLWKEGWNQEKALEVIERVSKIIGGKVKKPPYNNMRADSIYRDPNFQNLVMVTFANVLS